MNRFKRFFVKRLTHPPDAAFSHYLMYQPRQKQKLLVHLVLFILTVFSTLLVGAGMAGANPFDDFSTIATGIPFSFSLLLILGVHEFGHYFFARKWGVDVTLPYFIPAPTAIGTMGAVIRMRGPIPNRRALFEIGVAGPLAGFCVAVPVIIYGLYSSTVQPLSADVEGWILGDSLLFKTLSWFILGTPVTGYDVHLSTVAFAGWIGLLVTTLNLLPIGQLDGGHITYALFGRRFRYITWFIVALMAVMGFNWPGWWFWIVLTFLIGHRHPPPLDNQTPLAAGHRITAWVTLIIFIITFIPVPIKL